MDTRNRRSSRRFAFTVFNSHNKSYGQMIALSGRQRKIETELLIYPKRSGEGIYDLEFFLVGRYISFIELQEEYESRGLKPAPFDIVCSAQIPNSQFMEIHVATYWINDGETRYASFTDWDGMPVVYIRDSTADWCGYWWFAGLSKQKQNE